MSFVLDDSTALTRFEDRRYELDTDPRFWNMTSAFGGWVAAVTLAACEADADHRGELIAQTVQFHSAIKQERVQVYVRLLERRRTLDFWQVAIHSVASDARMLASATLIIGDREPTKLDHRVPPTAIRPQTDSYRLERRENSPSWFDHYELYLARGRPFRVNESVRSSLWLRESDGRPLDSKSLVAIVDTPMPRSFFLSEQGLFGSTVTMSTHVYATADEIAVVGNDFVRLDSDGHSVRHSFMNQESHLYREDGLLLAASYQTGIFRE